MTRDTHTHHNHRTSDAEHPNPSKQPPARPPNRPTGNHPRPVTADTGANTPTTRGP